MTETPTPRLEGAPRPAKVAPGTIVDGFRVLKLAGEGAMGEVYLAFDEKLGRRLALKFVKEEGLDERRLDRFLDEARMTARFNHPNIVTVYAAGTYQGRPYLALEYLDGESLKTRLERGPLSPLEAMRLARSVAEALSVAHEGKVVHADLKPENVVLPRDGRPRVVDFGLARLVGTVDPASSGTITYMSPERWTGAAPAEAMDVWSLGVVLHEMIEGKLPFTMSELRRLGFELKPTLGPAAAASPCAELLRECLTARPADRPSAAEVAEKLTALLEGARTGTVEDRSPFRGLSAFTEADAADFHGRVAEVDAVVERLRSDGLVPIVGPSGVGKSSFIFAGVLPRLREAGPIEVLQLRPGRRPLFSLATVLAASTGEPVQSVLDELAQKPGVLVAALERLHSRGDATRRLVLVVDQFEEVVTLGDSEEAAALIRALMTAASADEPWRILISLRSDFLGAFAANPELRPALDAVTVLRPLSRVGLEEAVSGPLKRVGYKADDDALPRRIATELEKEPAALPLLQFACDALWQRRDTARKLVLTREYEAMGGASGALATHAQRLVTELLPADRRHVRAVLLRLVTVDGTRRPRTREELLQGLPAEAAQVLDRLLIERLLVSGRHEDTDAPMVELAHEALVSTWPALSRWLAETKESRALVADIEQAATLWEKRGRRDDETWAGDALREALRRVDDWNVSLSSRPREFLQAAKARQARVQLRRRVALASTIAVLGTLTVAATSAAVAFREKERQAIAQQQQIRLAAADMGRFELVLAPFDWDAKALLATPVSAARLPALDWVFYGPSPKDDEVAGARLEEPAVFREERRVDGDGLHEIVEARNGVTFLAITGRGEGSEACPPSWVRFKKLPGFAERGANTKIVIPVPTCRATKGGTIAIPKAQFQYPLNNDTWEDMEVGPFAIDATEVTAAQFDLYGGLSRWTGDGRNPLPDAYRHARAGAQAVVGVSAAVADRFCAFFGKRLAHVNEWLRVSSRHPCYPRPDRLVPCANHDHSANLEGAEDGFAFVAPVGSLPNDVTTEGVFDLVGNVTEWTADTVSSGDDQVARFAGLRKVLGANWGVPPDAPPSDPSWVNTRPANVVEYSLGLRCVLESE